MRKYVLSYDTGDTLPNNFSLNGDSTSNSYCLPVTAEGTNRLTGIALLGTDAADQSPSPPLYTMVFQYQPHQSAYYDSVNGNSVYSWPYLSVASNGLGGTDSFNYEELGAGVDRQFSRVVVQNETHAAGAGQLAVTTNYNYANGPAYFRFTNPYTWTDSAFYAEYRGFGSVTETDASGNETVHLYYTTPGDLFTYWNDEVRTGREYDTTMLGAGGFTVSHTSTQWSVLAVSNNNVWGGASVNFVYPSQVTTTVGRGANATTTYNVNSFDILNGTGMDTGQPTQVDEYAGLPAGTKELTTVTHYLRNSSSWVVVPSDQEKLDAGGAVLSLGRFYYDGATSSTPASAPAVGLLTAQATQTCGPAPGIYSCPGNPSGSNWSASYSLYDQQGRVRQSSVPTSITPESPPPGSPFGAFGGIPFGVSYSAASFDSTTHPLPNATANALAQATGYQYDWRFQKPTQITEPNGHITKLQYDVYGRLQYTYDNYDPAHPGTPLLTPTTPVETFTYGWGNAPNLTESHHYIDSVNVHVKRSCTDGFGREIEHMESVYGSVLNDVRTDYDARGNKSVTTNPFTYDASTRIGCGGTPAATNRDRTTYTYDPLGNVETTTSIAGGYTSGPSTVSVHDGSTVMNSDERSRTTSQTSDPVARTLTVSPTTIVLRPSGAGAWGDWRYASPIQSHYLNVQEPLADDDGSQLNDQGFNYHESQRYPSAGLTATETISSVTLHFRWKQYDINTPNPNGPNMWAIFVQGGNTYRSPSTYQSTNAQGWRDDSWVMTTNPRTGQPWTVDDVNGVNGPLDFGFENYPTSGVWNYVTQTSLEIATGSTATSPTVYSYDPLGRLTNVTDAAGNQTSLAYDMAGNKVSMHDPDMGMWSYAYDAAGNLLAQTDALAITTTMTYDVLNRLKTKSYSNGDTPVSYTYDTYPSDSASCTSPANPAGMQTRMTDGSGRLLTCYDVRGQAAQSFRSVDGVDYPISTTYDGLGQTASVTYPDQDLVTYVEGTSGNVTGMTSDPDGAGSAPVQTLLSGVQPLGSGVPWHSTLGNGRLVATLYDTRQRLSRVTTSGGSQDLTISYDDASNVTSVTDATTSETDNYTYDKLNRLTGMTVNGAPMASYQYDALGNMTAKQEGTDNVGLCYPTNGVRPHAVSSIDATGGAGCSVGSPTRTFNYQADGSMLGGGDHLDAQNPQYTQRGGHAFDAENRVTQVFEARAGSAPSNPNGIACTALQHPDTGVVSASDSQLLFAGSKVAPHIGSPGFDPEMDLHEAGAISASDSQLEFAWFKTGQPCPTPVERYRYDGNGTLLERMVPGGLQPFAVWYPAGDGSSTQWYATGPSHSGALADAVDDTYIQGSTGNTLDTFKLATQNVPAGAIIEYVKLNFRWEASGSTDATLLPVYRQGTNTFLGAQHTAPAPNPNPTWVNDQWVLSYNPITGQYWTPNDVNSAMEFGFETVANPGQGDTPRVSQASVQVAYRLPATSSTIYIGGVYEANSDGSTVKYYGALGNIVAIRRTLQNDPNGAAGTLLYPLHDQLGSTVGLLDQSGNLVPGSTTKYWPYGGVRSGGISRSTQTDKQFTGQQVESSPPSASQPNPWGPDSALGLYNYRARFYSSVLGRFVSADPIASDGLNRYAYAIDNPLVFTDPTGLDVAVVCGFRQHCENGSNIDRYESFVEQYWSDEGYAFGNYSYADVFGLLKWVIENWHWDARTTLSAFGVAFLDTSTSPLSAVANQSLSKYVDKLTDLLEYDRARASERKIDTLIGYSEGGATVAKFLNKSRSDFPAVYGYVRFVLFLDPAFHVRHLGDFFGVGGIDQNDFPGIRFVTVNGYFTGVRGSVGHSDYNFGVPDCPGDTYGHCTHSQYGALIVNTLMGYCVPSSNLVYWILPVNCAPGY